MTGPSTPNIPAAPAIRLAVAADARPIAQMSRSLVEAGLRGWSWNPARVLGAIQHHDYCVAVAGVNHELAGFAIGEFGDNQLHVSLLAVARAHQRRSIGRALMANPKMVLLDEPSMGLAPQIVEEVFEIVKDLNTKERVTFLLAEQNTNIALRYADYGYILENGRVVMDGEAKALRENEDVKEFYLGMGGGDRKSFKDVKSYKRRKRWLA